MILSGFEKHSLTSGFICSIFQFDLSILLIRERVGLNVVMRGRRLLVSLVLYLNASFRDFVLAFFNSDVLSGFYYNPF